MPKESGQLRVCQVVRHIALSTQTPAPPQDGTDGVAGIKVRIARPPKAVLPLLAPRDGREQHDDGVLGDRDRRGGVGGALLEGVRQSVVVVEALIQEDVGLDGVEVPRGRGCSGRTIWLFPSAFTPLAPQHASNRAETEAAGAASTAIDRGSANRSES